MSFSLFAASVTMSHQNASTPSELLLSLLRYCDHRNKHLSEEDIFDAVNISANIDCNTIISRSVNAALNVRVFADKSADKWTL